MAAIRAERDYVVHEDFMKVRYFNILYSHLSVPEQTGGHVLKSLRTSFQAVRKLNDAKKLESSAHYSADFGKEWHATLMQWTILPEVHTLCIVRELSHRNAEARKNQPFMFRLLDCPRFLKFIIIVRIIKLTTGRNHSEFTNFEPVALCFSDHTLSASLCISLVTPVGAVSFPPFHVLFDCVSVLACLLGNRKRLSSSLNCDFFSFA